MSNDHITKKVHLSKEHNELLDMMLKKADLSIDDLFEVSYKLWINRNTDLLTETEKEKYKHLFLGNI
ncbi:MAG: hypothetical protein EAZ95_10280 [Bacteroidetes bacterium]|nr:MAG: hypothetical protein EAZ95_10280 [Bacteroidota bacterium]